MKSKLKKSLSLLLALAMVLSCMSMSAFAEGAEVPFPTANVKVITPAELGALMDADETAANYVLQNLGAKLDGFKGGFMHAEDIGGSISLSLINSGVTTSAKKAFVFTAEDCSGETMATYGSWQCDFVVSYDEDVKADSVVLTGYYGDMIFSILMGKAFEGNVTKQPLISSVGFNFDYNTIKNTVSPFLCVASNVAPENVGKTINVSLVMWPAGEDLTEENARIVTTIPYTFTWENLETIKVGETPYHFFGEGFDEDGYVISGASVAPQTEAGPHFAPAADKYVARIGGAFYPTLAEAVAAVPADGTETTITMIGDETIVGNGGVTIPTTKNIVLDLNGHTVKNAVNENKASQVITNNGILTIKDSGENGLITNGIEEGTQPGEWWSTPQYNYATNVIKNSGTLNMESGTIRQTAAGSICYAVDNNSTSYDTTFNMKGGLVTDEHGTVVRMFCNSTAKENIINVTGGEISTTGKTAIWTQLPGSNAASMKSATLNISGGKVSGGTYAWYDYTYGDGWDNVSYDISGGKLVGKVETAKTEYSFITGGLYTVEPDATYIAEGYEAVALTTSDEGYNDGYRYKVSKLPVAEVVGGAKFGTLQEAIDAATNGQTVKLLENVDASKMITINKSITIDGQNKKVTVNNGNGGYAFYYTDNETALNVTLKDMTLETTGYQVAFMTNCDNYSKATLDNVDIKCDGECIYSNGHCLVTAKNCNFTHDGVYATGKDVVYYSALIVGYAGEIAATNCKISSFGNGVATFPSGGTVTLTDTDITVLPVEGETNASGYALWARNEDYTNYPDYNCDSTINVKSGKVSGKLLLVDKKVGAESAFDPVINISGGIFDNDPTQVPLCTWASNAITKTLGTTDCVATGYVANAIVEGADGYADGYRYKVERKTVTASDATNSSLTALVIDSSNENAVISVPQDTEIETMNRTLGDNASKSKVEVATDSTVVVTDSVSKTTVSGETTKTVSALTVKVNKESAAPETVYVITDGTKTAAIEASEVDNKLDKDLVDVAAVLANSVTGATKSAGDGADAIDIRSITGYSMEVKQDGVATPAEESALETALNTTGAITGAAVRVYPEVTVTTKTTDGTTETETSYTYNASAESAGKVYTTTLTGLPKNVTRINVLHISDDGKTPIEEIENVPVNNGTAVVSHTGCSYLVPVDDSYQGTPAGVTYNKTNFVHRVYMNLQETLILNYQLYLTSDSTSEDYVRDGKIVVTFDGVELGEVSVSSLANKEFNESDMKVAVAKDGFYCARGFTTDGSPTPSYYVSFRVYPNKMGSGASVKLLKNDGQVASLYENNGNPDSGYSSASLITVENNVFNSTVYRYENKLLEKFAVGSVDYLLAQAVIAYGDAALAKYGA